MSSSASSYEPEEDDDASDSDLDTRPSRVKIPPSSPPPQTSRFSSPDETPYSLAPRSRRGTRTRALEDLQESLSRDSAATYSDLLDETESPKSTTLNGENYNATQNGIVTWTPKEKEILHSVLDRKGKNGVREIASALGSKSELEVQEHLRLLQRGLERQHLKDRHSRTVILGDIPAAAEVSRSCRAALDEYAQLLRLEEQQAEDVAGKQKHQDMWIIDRDTAVQVEEQLQLQSQEEPLPRGTTVYHTGELFNMKKWILLSERIFMNPAPPRLEDNWTNIAFADETPSVTADAFADFYALTVSVTRRLVQSSLFFAMSRLRNMRETGNPKARVVKARDVKAALDVMNMKRDRHDFWVGLARRCSLEVSDVRHRRGWKSVRMDHNEVEDVLSGRVPFDAESAGGRSISRKRSQSQANGTSDDDGSESDAQSTTSSVLSSPASSINGEEEELPRDLEDEHAEQVDQKASRLEEFHLWGLLGQAPESLNPEVKDEEGPDQKARKPTGERKRPQDLVDWRDRTLYRGDWEEHGHEVFDIYEDISEDKRKRRRLRRDLPVADEIYSSSEMPNRPAKEQQNMRDEMTPSEDEQQNEQQNEQQEDYQQEDEPEPMEVDNNDIHETPSPQLIPKTKPPSPPSPSPSPSPQPPPQPNPKPQPRIKPQQTRSPIQTRRRQKLALEQQQLPPPPSSSSSDNDLPQQPDTTYSSSEEEKAGGPLYSQPMSPADWGSE